MNKVRENNDKAAKRTNLARNKTKPASGALRIGDTVFRRNFVRRAKLDRFWIGPFTVTRISSRNVNIVTISDSTITERCNVKNLKLALRGDSSRLAPESQDDA